MSGKKDDNERTKLMCMQNEANERKKVKIAIESLWKVLFSIRLNMQLKCC